MVSAGNKAKRFSSANLATKTIQIKLQAVGGSITKLVTVSDRRFNNFGLNKK